MKSEKQLNLIRLFVYNLFSLINYKENVSLIFLVMHINLNLQNQSMFVVPYFQPLKT